MRYMKPTHILSAIIISLAVFAIGFGVGRNSLQRQPTATPSPTLTPMTPTVTAAAIPNMQAPGAPNPTPKRTEAVIPKIAFTKCVAEPNALTVKQNTGVRFENLDYTARRISMDIQVFNVLPRDYAIATAKPVGTYSILCDGAGVATLTVQP